jgi:uncharacterized protein (TIGR03663 family)
MQKAFLADHPSVNSGRGMTIPLQWVAYAAILALALVFRLAQLGSAPMQADEARAALAAYRTLHTDAAGGAIVSSSPFLFALQTLSFGLIGADEFASRILTALGGTLLALAPLLFRREIGATRAFVMSILLAVSPVAILASRFSSPTVWALGFAVLCLWAQARLRDSRDDDRRLRLRVTAAVSGAALILLSEPGGVMLAVILTCAMLIALVWERSARFDVDDDSESDSQRGLRGWTLPLGIAALAVVIVATGLLLYPAGLSAVGEVFSGALRGFTLRAENAPALFPLVVSLFYEPFAWVLALAGIVVLFRRDALTRFDRVLIAWIAVAALAALLWGGAKPDHALWFTVPLIGLAASAVAAALQPSRKADVFAVPYWARGAVALAALAVIAVFTIAFQGVARSLLTAPDGLFSATTPNPNHVILVVVSLMFMLIGYFLIASLWGNRTALQGIALALAIFGGLSSLGSGWGVTSSGADSPTELWHLQATHRDTALLRATLLEVAGREDNGFTTMPIVVAAADDGVIAWLLRDFTGAQYVSSFSEAAGQPIALLPRTVEDPPLGSSYVGQDFPISRAWSPLTIPALEIPAWWTQGLTRVPYTSSVDYVLWLRMDVYQGVDPVSIEQG